MGTRSAFPLYKCVKAPPHSSEESASEGRSAPSREARKEAKAMAIAGAEEEEEVRFNFDSSS